MVVGLFLDGWAHDNAKPESFFTPWHGLLYSGFAASAAAAVLVAMRARRGVRPWRPALPAGPGPPPVAHGGLAPGAVGDRAWAEPPGHQYSRHALPSPNPGQTCCGERDRPHE